MNEIEERQQRIDKIVESSEQPTVPIEFYQGTYANYVKKIEEDNNGPINQREEPDDLR